MRMSCFLDAAGSFLDVVAPNQQGCRVLHISKHERLAQTSRWPGVAFRSACERCPGCENALDPKMTNQRVDREGGRNISAPWAANSEPCPQKGLTDPIEKSTSVIVA